MYIRTPKGLINYIKGNPSHSDLVPKPSKKILEQKMKELKAKLKDVYMTDNYIDYIDDSLAFEIFQDLVLHSNPYSNYARDTIINLGYDPMVLCRDTIIRINALGYHTVDHYFDAICPICGNKITSNQSVCGCCNQLYIVSDKWL